MFVFGVDIPKSSLHSPTRGGDFNGLYVSKLDEGITFSQSERIRLEAPHLKKQFETETTHAIFGKKP